MYNYRHYGIYLKILYEVQNFIIVHMKKKSVYF